MSEVIFNGPESEAPFVFDYGWKRSFVFKTDVSQMFGGNEQRRKRWARPLRKYSIPMNNKSVVNLTRLQHLFYDMGGKYDTFLFYDTMSKDTWRIEDGYKTVVGAAVTSLYLPFKYIYPKTNPVPGVDVIVAINGTEITDYTGMVLDADDGKITFGTIMPAVGSDVDVTYEHYVRVRFDNDTIEATEKFKNLGDVTIELMEER